MIYFQQFIMTVEHDNHLFLRTGVAGWSDTEKAAAIIAAQRTCCRVSVDTSDTNPVLSVYGPKGFADYEYFEIFSGLLNADALPLIPENSSQVFAANAVVYTFPERIPEPV